MTRYVKKTKHTLDDDYYLEELCGVGNLTVYEQEPIDTGLLDSDGNPIFRTIDQIGFIRS